MHIHKQGKKYGWSRKVEEGMCVEDRMQTCGRPALIHYAETSARQVLKDEEEEEQRDATVPQSSTAGS